MQGGAGTSTNMNVNEVLANRALQLLGHAPGEYDVKSNVSVMYTDGDGHAHVLAVGTYEDRVRVGQGEARFVRKRVVLDNFTTPRYIVYPL